MRPYKLLFAIFTAFCAPGLNAAQTDWAEGSSSRGEDGASRDYYNRAALLPWKHFMGDWRDANNVEQGKQAYAVAEITDDDKPREVEWKITALVNEWVSGKYPNQGLFLRIHGRGGTIVFSSREEKEMPQQPKLIIEQEDRSITVEAEADTYLNKSTYRSQGLGEELRVSESQDNALIRFELSEIDHSTPIISARLVLFTTKQFGSSRIGVFRCRQGHDEKPLETLSGIAAKYPGDRGIAADPDVVFATGFEMDNWRDEWSQVGPKEMVETIEADSEFEKFDSIGGRALRSRIDKGATLGLSAIYKFGDKLGEEPEEIYFRYYLRLADDWNQTVQGGKMPGISGTYGRAGWGGRKVDGTNGWSARGSFSKTIPDGNPLAGTTPLGFYCYHADMKGSYGNVWIWQKDYRGYLETNRWYAIEQFCRMNSPGKNDGILRAWVDGRPAFEKTDIRFRDVDRLKIEQIWMNIYHGGTIPSPYPQHVFIDNVVVARKYIGPMTTDADKP